MKALIVGDGTGALAAARELGRAGWFVGIASGRRWGWGSLSRWTARWHHVPAPSGDLGAFVAALNQATAEQGYEVVFPATDTELLALSAVRDELRARLHYAPHDSVLRGVDKLELFALARECGVATPLTRAACEEALAETGFPVVVKPRLHWTPDSPGAPDRIEAAIAENRHEALRAAESMRRAGAEPVFQQFAPGDLVAHVVFADERHGIVADHFRVTLQERSSDTGPVALAASEPVPENLRSAAQAVVKSLQWVGLMTLQYQRTAAGEFYLIDLNGRIDGEYALTSACGLRAVEAWARLATGRKPGPARKTVVGPRYQAIEADLRRTLAEPGMRRVTGALPYLRDVCLAVHPIFQWSDPLPVLPYFTRRAARLLARLKPGGAGAATGFQTGTLPKA